MAYKRYIKKNGKMYGPYIYKSIRDKDGNVKNIYVKKAQPAALKSLKFTLQKIGKNNMLVLVAIILGIGLAPLLLQPTGMIIQEEAQMRTLAMNWGTNESVERSVTLSEPPKSISLSGFVRGNGSVRIYAAKNGVRYLVYERAPPTIGSPFTGMAITDGETGDLTPETLAEEEPPSEAPTEEEATAPEATQPEEPAPEEAPPEEPPTEHPLQVKLFIEQ